MKPSYSALYNKGSFYRGDTIDGWNVTLRHKETNKSIIPVAAAMWLKNPSGKKVYEFDIDIDQETGTVYIGPCPATVTEGFRPGTYYYDLEYTLESGKVRTYLKGQINILGDVSNVRP